jgi:RES domain-containing protein
MGSPPWDAARAIAAFPFVSYQGSAWRAHDGRYQATSYGGALRFSARFHRAPDSFSPSQVFPALYLALSPEVALGEVLRYMLAEHTSEMIRDRVRSYVLTEIRLTLVAVLDCRDLSAMGLTREALLGAGYAPGQELAAAAVTRGAEGILVPSATEWGDNLVHFPLSRRSGSELTVMGSRSMRTLILE